MQAVFVGSMIAVGLALIVYKGRNGWEDTCLNFAGMLAPVVAVAPTTDVGRCWSVEPDPLPVLEDGTLAGWVVTNIDNNVHALLITGGVGLILALVLTMAANRSVTAPITHVEPGTRRSLAATALVLLAGWWLIRNWDGITTHAHGYAALLMFVFLIGAIVSTVVAHRNRRDEPLFWAYAAVAAVMIVGGVLIPVTRIFQEHTVFALEAYEIAFFAVYWCVQTAENWNEKVIDTASVAETGK